MYKLYMNILLIFLIILALFYLYYTYNKVENFNNSQNSLSTYFQNNVDYDIIIHKNKHQTIKHKLWDGIWENTNLNIYVRFIQNNDKLLIAISSSIIPTSTSPPASPETTCTDNLFECIGQLNNSYNMFYIKNSPSCSNFTINSYDLTKLNGFIKNNSVTLFYNSISPLPIILTKKQALVQTSPYMKAVSPNVNSYSILPDSSLSNDSNQDYMNIAPSFLQSSYSGSNLNICNTFNYNSYIICYITNIGNVQTLNYQFFGPLENESALTMQYDKMNNILNQFLTTYRDMSPPDDKAISFTNCIENIKTPSTQTVQTICANVKYTYVPSVSNNNLYPVIWEINVPSSNTLNSCSFILSTSKLYNTPPKYAEFNNNNTTNLSLFNGGIKQELILENINIIKDNIITANIKTNNNLYLIPGNISGVSNNSVLVETSTKPEQNSKWLMIGFNISNLNNLDSILNSITN
jgi:hypothetical protein